MLGNPSNVGHAMTLADSTDSAMCFSGSWQQFLALASVDALPTAACAKIVVLVEECR